MKVDLKKAGLFVLGLFTSFFIQAQTEVLINEQFESISYVDFIEVLSEKYQVKCAYDPVALEGLTFSGKFDNLSLEESMIVLLKGSPLEYKIVGPKEILLRPKHQLSSNNSQTIKGFVLDFKSMEPLEGATVTLNSGKGEIADSDGYFEIEIKQTDTLLIDFLGYKSLFIAAAELNKNEQVVFYMVAQALNLQSVEVTDRMPLLSKLIEGGAIRLNPNELDALPSFVGGKDLFRSLQLLPGISASDDLSAQLKIRGGSAEGNLVMIDGITLYKSDHYLGIFSIVNPSIAGDVLLYKNDFPIEYGGRTSGVVDVSSRKPGLDNKISLGIDLNLLTSNIWTEIPMGKKMGLILGARTTNKDIADTGLFDPLDQNMRAPLLRNNPHNPNTQNRVTPLEPDFTFNDYNAKWLWKPSSRTLLRASYFRSRDNLDYTSSQMIMGEVLGKKIKFIQNNTEEGSWGNDGWSAYLSQDWKGKWKTELLISGSEYNTSNFVQTTVEREEVVIVDTVLLKNRRLNEVNGLNVNFKNTIALSTNHKWIFGADVKQNKVLADINVDVQNVLNQGNTRTNFTAFGQYQFRTDDFQLRLGGRLTHYDGTGADDLYFSPRAAITLNTGDYFKLKASVSRNHQFLRMLYHEDRYGRVFDFWVNADGDDLPVAHTTNFMIGGIYSKNDFSLDVEFYHKKTDNFLEHARSFNGINTPLDGNGALPEYLIYQGSSLSRGMDIMLKKSFSDYSSWIAYSLSEVTNSFREIDHGNSYPAQDDQRHQLKWINQYRLKKWDFSMTYVFASGHPYTDLSAILVQRNRGDLPTQDRLEYLSDYHRVDVGINYRFKPWGKEASIGASIFNLLDRDNVKYVQYTFVVKESDDMNKPVKNTVVGTELNMLGFTPNVSFSITF